jgi:hypothetical protein
MCKNVEDFAASTRQPATKIVNRSAKFRQSQTSQKRHRPAKTQITPTLRARHVLCFPLPAFAQSSPLGAPPLRLRLSHWQIPTPLPMCNHYRKGQPVIEWTQFRINGLHIAQDFAEIVEHTWPKYPAPIVIQQDGRRSLVSKSWGIPITIKGDSKSFVKPVPPATTDSPASPGAPPPPRAAASFPPLATTSRAEAEAILQLRCETSLARLGSEPIGANP